jgi:HK97 family phage portal protein
MAELTIFGALRNAMTVEKALHPVPDRGWHRLIREPFAGAWQNDMEEKQGTVLCYPALYACLSRINQDIGKLPFVLKREDGNGIWQAVENTAYSPVLRKPNHYQTAQQFREAWVLSKLVHGNTYVLKRRDDRGVVTALYVLDPCRVMPMVSDSGDVFYQINYNTAANLLPENYPAEQLTIPAREIIHDRLNCFHHQLIGVPPLCAAHWAAVKNLKILKSSAEFFNNHAQPGGILTAPAGMSDDDANELRSYWQTNYSGENSGKVAVIGADMKFTSFAMNSADSQLVEQMRYSDEQICQPFGVKPYKIGIGQVPGGWKSDDVNVEYFGDALSPHVESMENLLDEGLGISRPLGVELDSSPLWRMDEGKQADVESKLVGGKIKTPDEARRTFNLSPTGGGDTIWGQHQDYPLGMLADRTDLNPVPVTATEDSETANEEVRRLTAELWQRKALEATREALHD